MDGSSENATSSRPCASRDGAFNPVAGASPISTLGLVTIVRSWASTSPAVGEPSVVANVLPADALEDHLADAALPAPLPIPHALNYALVSAPDDEAVQLARLVKTRIDDHAAQALQHAQRGILDHLIRRE